jgi:hypothetical protein
MRYRVATPVLVPASAYVDVEADSPADALVAAEGLSSSAWRVSDLATRPTDLDITIDDEADVWPIDRHGNALTGDGDAS